MANKALYFWLLLVVFAKAFQSKDDNSKELHLTATRRNLSGCYVAFYATKKGSGYLRIPNRVRFENVIHSENDAYDRRYGLFTAPINGTYVFSATIVMKNTSAATAAIYVNSRSVGKFVGENMSRTITVKLKRGDYVDVQVENGSPSDVLGNDLSSFTGYQIKC